MRKVTASDSPDASILLTGHNQVPFIKEAIEGAFRQTYPRLEIIISDDASTDDTYSLMRDMVDAYDGPHRVVLNRCERNLGITQHTSLLASKARGKYLFVAGGDDISLPERVERCMAYWSAASRKPGMVFTNLRTIDEAGQTLAPGFFRCTEPRPGVRIALEFAANNWGRADIAELDVLPQSLKQCVIGASMAFDRALIDDFGPLPASAAVEDLPLSFRAKLHGGIDYIDEVQVLYRRHGGNFMPEGESEEAWRAAHDRDFRHWAGFTEGFARDLQVAKRLGLIRGKRYRRLRGHILYALYRRKVEIDVADGRLLESMVHAVQGAVVGGRRIPFYKWLCREYLPATLRRPRMRRGSHATANRA